MESTNKEKLIKLFNLCIADEKLHASNAIKLGDYGSYPYTNYDEKTNKYRVLNSVTWFDKTVYDSKFSTKLLAKLVAQNDLKQSHEYLNEFEEELGKFVSRNNLTINLGDLPHLHLSLVTKTTTICDEPKDYEAKTFLFIKRKVKFTKKTTTHKYSFKITHGTIEETLSLEEGLALFKAYNESIKKNDLKKLDERINKRLNNETTRRRKI